MQEFDAEKIRSLRVGQVIEKGILFPGFSDKRLNWKVIEIEKNDFLTKVFIKLFYAGIYLADYLLMEEEDEVWMERLK